jgi:phosphate:Na+ symporter
MAFEVYRTDNVGLARKVEPLDAVIKKGVRRAKNNHIQRLKDGICSIDSGLLFSDLLTDLRRISAHCSNIATSVIQLHSTKFAKHKYSNRNKDEDLDFKLRYKDYKSKYQVKKNYE